MTVVGARELWERRVDKAITMYQYGAKTEQEMVSDLVRMGFDEEDLYDILDGDFEDEGA